MILADLPPGAEARPGVVYLVGAGPGDPGLITVRALELLATADVVLHDELVPRALLARVRADAELRWVGKRGHRPDQKQNTQRAIDAQLVELARAGRSVVRLKGGDPFLFGRGSEEAETLARAGIPFEVVPGVTSPLAAAAYAGISLTHRDLASTVTFVSATTRDGAPFDARRIKDLGGTLCVLMGLHVLDGFLRDLVELAGLAPTTPVAVVSAGTRPSQRVVEGTLEDVAARVAAAGLTTPAIAIVGAVASLRSELRWFDRWPLFGRRVLVTRAEGQARGTAALLARRGAEAVVVPTIQLGPPPDPAGVVRAVHALSTYDLVVFTSENAVDRLFGVLAAEGRDARAFGRARVASIGEGTSRSLEAHGITADLVPTSSVGEALAAAVIADLEAHGGAAGRRVLLPRALVARDVLPDRVSAAGALVDVVPVYATTPASGASRELLRGQLASRAIDVVLLTSSSTADNLCDLLGDDAQALLAGTLIASIGPVTTRTAERRGLHVDVTALKSTIPTLVDAVERHLSRVHVVPSGGGTPH